MKTYFKNMLLGYTGTCDGLVYYFNRRLNRVIVRLWVKGRITPHHRRFGRISTNLKNLGLSEPYKRDLRIYADIFNSRAPREGPILQNWHNAFTQIMWNLVKATPGLDLETITREQIEAADLPCRSVKRAVEAGLLKAVPGYELLDKLM